MILRIEGRTDKHSVCTGKHPATNSRTEAQRIVANTPAGEVEKLLLSCVFRLLLSATEEKERHQTNPPSPKPVTGKKLCS